ARVITGTTILSLGYLVNGIQWVRWTADNGGSWTDSQLSTGATDFSPDIYMDRDTNEFYSCFSAPDGASRPNVKARHGQFVQM
ncbi:MAG: hypothetical protein ABI743_08920, partial [bacterium]